VDSHVGPTKSHRRLRRPKPTVRTSTMSPGNPTSLTTRHQANTSTSTPTCWVAPKGHTRSLPPLTALRHKHKDATAPTYLTRPVGLTLMVKSMYPYLPATPTTAGFGTAHT